MSQNKVYLYLLDLFILKFMKGIFESPCILFINQRDRACDEARVVSLTSHTTL